MTIHKHKSCCAAHTWHIDVDAAVLHFLCDITNVGACVVASVHCSGTVHSDAGDEQAAVVLLCLLIHRERGRPAQLSLSATR